MTCFSLQNWKQLQHKKLHFSPAAERQVALARRIGKKPTRYFTRRNHPALDSANAIEGQTYLKSEQNSLTTPMLVRL